MEGKLMPKFSIVVPMYNVEEYIEKCVSSILNQTFTDFELIIVDDGATDNSAKKAQKFVDENPEKIKLIHQENKGLGGARNTGLENATGEYIWFIDSDDSIKENALEEINAFIDKNQVEIVVFDYCTTDENDRILETVSCYDKANEVFSLESSPDMLFMTNSAWNKVYKCSLFEKTKVKFPDREWFEDLSTVIKLYPFADRVGYINQCFYCYFQRSGSIMYSKNIERNIEIISAVDSLIRFYKENNLFDKYKDELEYLAVLHIYVLASVRVVKADSKSKLLDEFREYIQTNFPSYHNNKYVLKMSKKEQLIIKLLDGNQKFVLKNMLRVNDALKR